MKILVPIIHDSVEFLPVKCETRNLFVVNVLRVIDCLDHDHSRLVKSPSTGKVLMIDQYSFYDGCTDNHNIFKIPEMLTNHVFVSDEFKATVEDNNLGGLLFIRVA